MVDFRKAILLLAVLVFATGLASAQALNCTLNGGAPPLLRAEGVAEEVGQAFIQCTGGAPTVSGAVPRINVRLFTNGYNITSRLFTYGNTTVSEATLLIDDPTPSNQVLATIPPAACNAPFSSACGNVWLAYPVAGNPQAIEWRDIPFDPPGTGTRTLRMVNIRVNAALATGGNVASLIPPPVNIFISITGTLTLPITSPFLAVGYIQNGLAFSLRSSDNKSTITSASLAQCSMPSAPAFYARFTELFPTAFRIRGDSAAQNNLTQVYNTESMFWGPVYAPVGATVPPGQATQATRLRLAFTGVPTGVNIYVPSSVTSGTIQATLVAVGVDGSTADSVSSPPVAGTWLVGITGGSGSAVYEVTTTATGSNESFDVPVYIGYSGLPALGTGNVLGSYAPLSTVDTASSTAPAPRFYQNPAATYSFSVIACETRLLFPFLTSIPGWDTGIAISNTTVDPFNTPAQEGSCTLYFYGTPSNSSQTSASIPAGGQLLMTLSNGNSSQNLSPLTGFTGYMIARCNFQYAHGYAFISDLGANKFAQGYIALILGDGQLTKRFAGNASEALNQ